MIRLAVGERPGSVPDRNWECVVGYECFRTSSKAVWVIAVKLVWFAVAVAAAGVAVKMLDEFRFCLAVRQWFLCDGGTGRRLEQYPMASMNTVRKYNDCSIYTN